VLSYGIEGHAVLKPCAFIMRAARASRLLATSLLKGKRRREAGGS
jgi:hypothetical protein